MSDSSRYERIGEIFALCVDADPDEREAIVAREPDDPELRAEVMRLLQRDAQSMGDGVPMMQSRPVAPRSKK